MRWMWILGCLSAATAAERVDFGYAFAPPHRITVGRPGDSVKTLLDVEPGALTISWSYEDLRGIPLAAWKPPQVRWRVHVQPRLDGQPILESTWSRGAEALPMLDNLYRSAAGTVRMEAIGAATGALVRATVRNTDVKPHRFSIACEMRSAGWCTTGLGGARAQPRHAGGDAARAGRPGFCCSRPAPRNQRYTLIWVSTFFSSVSPW